MTGRSRWRALAVGLAVCSVGIVAGPALAHGGGLGPGGRESLTVPTWLVLLTGGAAVGASFLLASFVTDRRLIRDVEGWTRQLSVAEALSGPRLRRVGRALGVVALLAVITVGVVGPQTSLANAGLLVVWVGWWAGYTISTYLLGNSWPALNPWRTIADALPSRGYSLPDWGAWPATVALLAFIWLEVASPISDAPRVLAAVVVAYSVVTVAGAVSYGAGPWFRTVDPIARVFRHYGRVAPIQPTSSGLSVRLPGASLGDLSLSGRGEVAFVVALLWVTTFDGFVATPTWRTVATTLSGPVPLSVLYPLVLGGGFALFLGIFYAGARLSRHSADSYLTTGELARQFAPSLVAIAAGYHFAHYLGYFLSLAPALAVVATAPLAPPAEAPVLALPGWFELVGMAAILVGHLLAIWVAHATAYEIFPGRLQAIRSQYPFIVVMVFYTMTSLWIVAQPEVAVP